MEVIGAVMAFKKEASVVAAVVIILSVIAALIDLPSIGIVAVAQVLPSWEISSLRLRWKMAQVLWISKASKRRSSSS